MIKQLMKGKAKEPNKLKNIYLKFGFVETLATRYYCPTCGVILNCGPDYQPKYCSECGQRLDFKNATWPEEQQIRVLPAEERGGKHEAFNPAMGRL